MQKSAKYPLPARTPTRFLACARQRTPVRALQRTSQCAHPNALRCAHANALRCAHALASRLSERGVPRLRKSRAGHARRIIHLKAAEIRQCPPLLETSEVFSDKLPTRAVQRASQCAQSNALLSARTPTRFSARALQRASQRAGTMYHVCFAKKNATGKQLPGSPVGELAGSSGGDLAAPWDRKPVTCILHKLWYHGPGEG